MLEQWLKVALEAPPAVCPKMKQLILHAVHLALLFPGVPIMGGKSDLADDEVKHWASDTVESTFSSDCFYVAVVEAFRSEVFEKW